jgi:hypothetical protein
MTPEQREPELELLADHKIHETRRLRFRRTCSALEWDRIAEELRRRKVVEYLRTAGIIRLL